jgi:hypothetical protein
MIAPPKTAMPAATAMVKPRNIRTHIVGSPMSLGEVGKETISALKSQPLLLVVVILNVLMLFMVGYSVRTAQENNHSIVAALIEKCGK